MLTKEQATKAAPEGWSYMGYWDGLYHYQYRHPLRMTLWTALTLSVTEQHVESGMLVKCAERILS